MTEVCAVNRTRYCGCMKVSHSRFVHSFQANIMQRLNNITKWSNKSFLLNVQLAWIFGSLIFTHWPHYTIIADGPIRNLPYCVHFIMMSHLYHTVYVIFLKYPTQRVWLTYLHWSIYSQSFTAAIFQDSFLFVSFLTRVFDR